MRKERNPKQLFFDYRIWLAPGPYAVCFPLHVDSIMSILNIENLVHTFA